MNRSAVAAVAAADAYAQLPAALQAVYSRREYAWLTDADRATLIERECNPDWVNAEP